MASNFEDRRLILAVAAELSHTHTFSERVKLIQKLLAIYDRKQADGDK